MGTTVKTSHTHPEVLAVMCNVCQEIALSEKSCSKLTKNSRTERIKVTLVFSF